MTPEMAYEMLKQIQHINEDYKAPDNEPTFLVVQLTPNENNDNMDLHTMIVDPSMPESGDTKDYLALPPVQRLMLELSTVVQEITPNMATVCVNAPLDEDLWKHVRHNQTSMCKLIRILSSRAAVLSLQLGSAQEQTALGKLTQTKETTQ